MYKQDFMLRGCPLSALRATLLAEIAFKRQFDKGSRYRRFFRAFLPQEKKRKKGKQGAARAARRAKSAEGESKGGVDK